MDRDLAVVAAATALILAALPGCQRDDWFGSGFDPPDDDTGDDDDDDSTFETDSGGPGQFTAIDTDVHNAAHIAHYALFWHHDDPASTRGQLRHATNGGNQWSRSDISGGGYRGAQTALVVDAEDNLHVSYFHDGGPSYAYRENVQWDTASLDPGAEVKDAPGVTSVDVDGSGQVHASYFDGEDLIYAASSQEGWVTETVAEIGEGYGDHALAVDSSGTVHIVFHDAGAGALRHAHGGAGNWTLETVDEDGEVGRHASLAIAAADVLHIAYRDVDGDTLRHAWGGASGWSTEVVDSTGEPGAWGTGIDVGPDGTVHISYYASDDGDLRHALLAESEWEITVIDSAGDVGRHSSVAVDLAGEIHIAYLAWKAEDETGALKYASNLTGFWEIELVEDAGDVDLD